MATPVCRSGSTNALRAVFSALQTTSASLPAFLLPAYSSAAHFSTTAPSRSKIGRAPLSLPPDVTFTITNAHASAKSGSSAASRTQLGSTVEIAGPKGKMNYTMPPYMTIARDEDGGAHTLSVEDAEVRKQREMWGQSSSSMDTR